MVDLSIVVPCYNEEKNIPLIVKRFKQILPRELKVELILVDNGSEDESNKILRGFVSKYSFIKLVHVKKNIGYGFGVWSGLKKVSGQYVCWTHADMQTDPEDTIKAYQLIIKQEDPKKCFVKGKRKGRGLLDSFFAVGMSIFETIILRKIFYDINAQPNLFHKSFLNKINNPPKDFSFDLYFYYMAKELGYKIKKIGVLFPKRIHGESHWNVGIKGKWKFIKRTLDYSFELKERINNEGR